MPNVKRQTSYILVALLLFTANSLAIDFVQTNQFIVSETNVLMDETWVSAQSVNISGAVSNDFFARATDLSLNGYFDGDVWCAGDVITGTGSFRNSARMIARVSQIQGTYHGSVIVAGTTVKIDRTAVLYNDLLCLGENVIIEGSVSGNVRILAQRVTLGGQFKEDLSITAQEIVILPGAIINGSLSYSAPDELVLPPSVILGGELVRRFQAVAPRRLFKEHPGAHFMFALAALLAGLAFSSLFPRYTATALHVMRETRGFCLLAGFAGLVILPMASFFIFLTLIGIPLSMLVFLFYLILLYLSRILVALWIGSALLRRTGFDRRKIAAPMALGLLILYTLTCITAAEFIINILAVILGLGALLIALFKKPVLIIQTPESVNETNKEG